MSRDVVDRYIKRHEDFLKNLFTQAEIPANTIKKAIEYSLFPGGKRIRPILVYLTGNLVSVNDEILDYIAASVEITHCYSLIHDDLPAMDDDDFRRGKKSCHKEFSEATAILAGDGMQGFAIQELIANLPKFLGAEKTIKVVHELIQATGLSGMVSGQSLDIERLDKQDVTIDEIKKIHTLKTGMLIAASVKMAVLASNCSSNTSASLSHFANELGLTFQIQDDYLDYYQAESLGKVRSSDKANNKKTFACFYSKEELQEIINNHYNSLLEKIKIITNNDTPLANLINCLKERSNITADKEPKPAVRAL